MKREIKKTTRLSTMISALLIAAAVTIFCTQIEFDNPLDPKDPDGNLKPPAPPTFTLITNVNNTAGCIVTPWGMTRYPVGTLVSVTATRLGGYVINRVLPWTGAPAFAFITTDPEGLTSTITFEMNRDITLIANCLLPGEEPKELTLTLHTFPPDGGTVNLPPVTTQISGVPVTLIATPNEGFDFVSWIGEHFIFSERVLPISLGSDFELTAFFADTTTPVPPPCVPGVNCDNDLGSCTNFANNVCNNNISRAECVGTFAAGQTCPILTGSCTAFGNCTNNVLQSNCNGTFVLGGTCPPPRTCSFLYCCWANDENNPGHGLCVGCGGEFDVIQSDAMCLNHDGALQNHDTPPVAQWCRWGLAQSECYPISNPNSPANPPNQSLTMLQNCQVNSLARQVFHSEAACRAWIPPQQSFCFWEYYPGNNMGDQCWLINDTVDCEWGTIVSNCDAVCNTCTQAGGDKTCPQYFAGSGCEMIGSSGVTPQ